MSLRGLWTDEANEEAEKIMNSKISALNITGTNAKVVAKEVFNSMYELTKIGQEPAKQCLNADTSSYLAMKPADITRDFLTKVFADTVDCSKGNVANKRRSHYNSWDKFTVPSGYFWPEQPEIKTTVGRFIFNKFILEGAGIIEGTGFIDAVVNKGMLGNIDELVAQLYMKDKINRKQFNNYLDRRDTLGYWLNGMLAHTISQRMLKPLPEIEKRKAELCKKYEKELAEHNVDVMAMISDELIKYAKELLKDDPGMDLYLSGDLDFANNYRNNCIIKGAVVNKITGEYDFISTSFMDGIAIKDLPAHANSILASQYPASIATADAGYRGKKLMALLQMMEVDEPGTDCGTKNTIPIKITKQNAKFNTEINIIENGQEHTITEENVSSYIGRTVEMRSPMSCKNEKICAKCAGNLFHMLGVEHAGLFATQISFSELNGALKAKHNSVVTLYHFDPDNIIEDL